MPKVRNRVKETTLTAGSGNISLVGPVSGFQAFGNVLSSGDTTYYTIVNKSNWEVGQGTYAPNILSRDVIFSSSNSGQKINLSGKSDVFIAYPAEKSVFNDGDDRTVVGLNGIVFADSSVQTSAYTDEKAQDAVSSLLVAGTGIQLNYNDSGNALSIDAYGILPTGGSAGQILSKVNGANYNTEWIDNYAKEVVQYVKNSTHTTLSKGQAVYINGADGTNPTIGLAIASGESTSSKTLGFLKQNLNHGDFGYVVTEGFLDGLNTNGATTEGDPIWLSPSVSGGVVYGLANKPYAPNHLVFLGYVIRKNTNNGRIYVKIQNGFELKELHDVVAQSPNDGDIIRYVGSSGLWMSTPMPVGYTDENAQDAVGWMVQNSSNVSLSYTDNTPSLIADLVDTSVVAGGYGSTNQVATFTVDAKGRLTAAGNATITPSSIGALGSLNGLTGSTQTFETGTSGSDFNIVSSGTAHTFNLPDAGATARGVVTTGSQTFAGTKTFIGELSLTPTARTSGSNPLLNLIAPADTTRAASVEATDINFNLARTVQFAAGNITDQRAIRIQAPTYSFASASTIATASTLSISGAPVAGTNATLTNRWALSIENNGIKLAFPSASTSSLGLSRPPSTQWMYLVNTTSVANRPIGIVFGGYDNFFHMALQSVMTSGAGNTYGKLSFVQQGGSEWLKIATSVTAEQNGVSVAESLSFGVLASNISPDTSLVREAAGVLAFRLSTTSHIARLYNTFTDASNHERLAFQFGTFSSVRHAQIAAESAGTGTANINLVLTPRGTGAFILGLPPDGAATGGNARGQYAVDLQTSRASAGQVAAGTASVIGGGAGNQAIGDYATVAGGLGCQANAIGATCGGGRVNWVGSPYATVSGGFQNNTYSSYCFIGGGIYNENAGDYSGILSGFFCRTTKPYTSITGGNQALANRYGMRAQNGGTFGVRGDCQLGELVLRGSTTTNVAVRLRPDGSSERLTIASGQICQYLLIITGVRQGGSEVATYMRKVCIKNIGGTTTLVGNVETIGTDLAVGTSLSITADDVNDDLAVEATGVLNQNWRWNCVVYGGEISHE